MSTKKNPRPMQARIIKGKNYTPPLQPIKKADTTTQVTEQEAFNAGDWIEPPYELAGLHDLVRESTILPQCIRAYKDNIAGFGIGVRYAEDVKESDEANVEYNRMAQIIELLNTEQDTKEVFEDLIEARETYGVAYLEVIRNLDGEVQQIEFLHDTPSIRMTVPLEPRIETTYFNHGEAVQRKKKFRKFRQQVGGKTVYFKEFGDPRRMDWRDGRYLEDGEALDLSYEANEILDFSIGIQPYGEVRWIGQVLGVDGSRRAERLNNNYFINGRHTPLMIMIQGGTLTDESYDKLTKYMDDIKGEAGQHAFIVLETESTDSKTDFDETEKLKIEVKDLASILQKDELFQSYMDNNRKKVQSSFLLPDLYTGYTTDFNRATAQTAQEVTEKQVFQPERKSLAWAINNRLLNAYGFKYVEAYFLEPNISNPDDITKLLTAATAAGGVTPNKAKEILYKYLGEDSDDYDEEWGNVPLSITNSPSSGGFDLGALTMALDGKIQKAASRPEDAQVYAVMKEVRKLLVDLKQQQEGEQ